MIREDRFMLSRKQYAVDLDSLIVEEKRESCRAQVTAVWYRRRQGVTIACYGSLWDYQDSEPATAVEFLERHTDGRYGGAYVGRWDGENYWSERPQSSGVRELHLAVLRPMLEDYPVIPDGYSAWWTFQPPRKGA